MYLNTVSMPWVNLRNDVTSDDTLLTAGTDFSYSIWPTTNTVGPLHTDAHLKDCNALGIGIYGKDTNNYTGLYNLYGRARNNGMVALLLTGIATLGTRVVTDTPVGFTAITALWADTITVTGGLLMDITDILDSGNNRMCLLKFDRLWWDDLYMEFDLDGGSGTSMTEMNSILIGY